MKKIKKILLALNLVTSANLLSNILPDSSCLSLQNINFNLELQNAMNLGDLAKFHSLINENPKLAINNKKLMQKNAKEIKKIDEEILKKLEQRYKFFQFLKKVTKAQAMIFLAWSITAFGFGLKISLDIDNKSRTVVTNQAALDRHAANAVRMAMPRNARFAFPARPTPTYEIKHFYKNPLFIGSSFLAILLGSMSASLFKDKDTFLNNKIYQETSNIKFINNHIENIDKIITYYL